MKFKESSKETMLRDLGIIAGAAEHICLTVNHRVEIPETSRRGMLNSVAKMRVHLGELEAVITREDSYE